MNFIWLGSEQKLWFLSERKTYTLEQSGEPSSSLSPIIGDFRNNRDESSPFPQSSDQNDYFQIMCPTDGGKMDRFESHEAIITPATCRQHGPVQL